jgi:hypothetical protein
MHGAIMKRDIRRTGVPATIKGESNPAYASAVHNRRSTDLLAAGQYSTMNVEDPYEVGGKVQVERQLRGDPLGRLHAHRQIDEAQYHGGRAFQEDFETAERGPRAIDPTKEAVDGGQFPEPITEGQRKAVMRLNRAERTLGADGAALIHDVLVNRKHIREVGEGRGLSGERWEKYFGLRFRECLDTLARLYGFAINPKGS